MPSLPVVDLGCYAHPEHRGVSQDSIERLVGRFRPPLVHGFDPHPDLREGTSRTGRAVVVRRRLAAWLHDGTVAYDPHPDQPLRAAVGEGPVVVRCFDLARWLAGRRVIVKMDVQGAEYPLLERIVERGRDVNIERLLVEWHGPPNGPDDWQARRDALLGRLSCPVEEWEPVTA